MMKSTSKPISRRSLLRGMGVGAGMLPLLAAESARGACLPVSPKRLIITCWPNGVQAWPGPADTAAAITLPAFMKDLEPFKSDLLLMTGLRFRAVQESPNPKVPADGHQSHAGLLTGKRAFSLVDKYSIADGPSIDEHVGAALAKKGFAGVPALRLGVNHTYAPTTWRASRQPAAPDNDPYHVFDTLFAGAMGTGPNPEIEKTRMLKKSILDHVGRDLERFAARLGTEDRTRVGAHLDSVRQIEKQLAPAAKGAQGCAAPALTMGAKLDLKASASFPALWKLQMDLCVAAMAADLSRVAVIQVGNDSNHHLISTWFNHADSHHDIAHGGSAAAARKIQNDAWYYQQWAYLLGKLKGELEGGKPMLASTACVQVHNMEHGVHPVNKVPWIIAGGCNGYFRTGRSVVFPSVPHNGVLVALANAMDVPTPTFGDPEYGGELAGLRA